MSALGACGLFGGAVSAVWWVFPSAPSGELLLFRRSCQCRSLCAASGDLCLFLLSRVAVFYARCVAALAAAVALCVCPLRFRCADVGSFWPALCVAVVLPYCAACGCALLASSARPSGVFAVPRSCPISDLWFLSCGSCDGLAAAVLLSIGLAAPAFLRLPRASPRGLLSRALFI